MTKQELLSTYTAEQLAEMVIEAYEREDYPKITAINIKGFPKMFTVKEIEEIVTAYEEIKICQELNKKCKTILPSEYLKVLTLNQTVSELQSEVEKYRKAFENAKKERDQQVCEYQKKIEELTAENKKYLEQIMASILLSYGYSVSEVARAIFEHCNSNAVRLSNKNRFDYSREIKKAGKDGCEIYILGLIKCLQGLCNGENYTEENLLSKFLPAEPIKVADMLINAEGEYEHNPIEKAFCGTDKGKYKIFDVSELRQIAEHLLIYCNHNEEEEE